MTYLSKGLNGTGESAILDQLYKFSELRYDRAGETN